MTEDAAWPLAQHICRTGYADLPVSAVECARRDILDTFGCMLGGSGSPGIGELFAVISHWGGLPESRVLLRGIRLPAPSAALLNASMGHALDFDDTLDSGGSIHPGVSVLASVLAVCDSLNGVTGRDLLLAVALGLDISCRIALASTLDRGWHRTAAFPRPSTSAIPILPCTKAVAIRKGCENCASTTCVGRRFAGPRQNGSSWPAGSASTVTDRMSSGRAISRRARAANAASIAACSGRPQG